MPVKTRSRRMGAEKRRKVKQQLINEFGLWCRICHNPIHNEYDATIDHKIPLARGGTNYYRNLQLAHWACNNKKGHKLRFTENRPFLSAFQDIGLIEKKPEEPMRQFRYIKAKIWGVFPATIDLKTLEISANDEHWWMIVDWAFDFISNVCITLQGLLGQEPYFAVDVPAKEMAKIGDFDKLRLERML